MLPTLTLTAAQKADLDSVMHANCMEWEDFSRLTTAEAQAVLEELKPGTRCRVRILLGSKNKTEEANDSDSTIMVPDRRSTPVKDDCFNTTEDDNLMPLSERERIEPLYVTTSSVEEKYPEEGTVRNRLRDEFVQEKVLRARAKDRKRGGKHKRCLGVLSRCK